MTLDVQSVAVEADVKYASFATEVISRRDTVFSRPQLSGYRMKELPTADLGRLRRLVPARGIAGHMGFVHAVIDGQQPGWVLVDNPVSRRSALVFNHCGFGFALGEARSDLVGPMLRELVVHPWIVARPTALWCTEATWEPVLRPYFSEKFARDEFHFEPERTPLARLPNGYRLRPIDEELATCSVAGINDFVQIW